MKKRFKKKRVLSSDMVLQITSMADIFTILLVFLLKSFSTGVSNITPSGNMTLPEANQAAPIVETMKLEIMPYSIMVDEKPVLSLRDFQFEPNDLDPDGSPRQLNAVLAEQRKKDTLKKYPRMLVMADQKTPFSTLKRVLMSASGTGFVDYKLVVVEEE